MHTSLRWAAALAACLFHFGEPAAKNTPFGTELIAANYPNTTYQDLLDAVAITRDIGGHSSRIWYWGDEQAIGAMPILLQLEREAGLRTLVQMSSIFVGEPAPPAGMVKSFANAATRQRYLTDVGRLAAMRPDYLVLMTEANIMYRFYPAEFKNYQSLYAEAYNKVKSISPNTKVGLSYLHTLWYVNQFIDGIDVPALTPALDFVGFTTYPEDLVRKGVFASIADIPASWYGSTRQAYPKKTICFTEVGWASKVYGTPEVQAEYVRNLPRLMSLAKPELITWAVLHDTGFYTRELLDAPTTAFLVSLGVDIDSLFGHFNGMGLFDSSGNAKPAFYDAARLVFPQP
jgi:hypothetical protein